MKIEPKNGYMPVRSDKKLITESGLILPVESDDEAQTTHAVVVIPFEGSEYKVGDIVLFSKLVPDDVVIEDEKGEKQTLWFVKVNSIKGVIKK